jgi:SAM-dependent methyltransferase
VKPLHWLRLRAAVPPNPFRFDPRLERLVDSLSDRIGAGGRGVNLGSGETLFGPRVVNVDLKAFPGVHIRANGERLPFRDRSIAFVMLRGVLEHVRHAESVRDEVRRVLAPDGMVYVEVPFLQPYHESPEDHRRFTLPGLRYFLREFEEIEAGVQIGPGSTLSWVLREFVASLLSFGSPWWYRKILALAGWTTFWLRALDRAVVPAPHVAHAASAVYFLGRKAT